MTQDHKPHDPASARRLYLTAKYRQINRKSGSIPTLDDANDDPLELPFGVVHLRRDGSTDTVCGTPAQAWPVFVHLAIAEAETLCPECANAVQ